MASKSNRPLSPHLQIYKPQITSVLSICHRMTGIILAGGSILLICWLLGLARGPETFATMQGIATSWFGKIILFGWTFAFFYHLLNGVRHLMWDAGKGFELDAAKRSGIAVIVGAIVFTVLVFFFALGNWS